MRTPPDSSEPAGSIDQLPDQHHGLRRAVAADIPALSAMLARAFSDDPFWRWMAPSGPGYSTRLERAFNAQLKHLAMPGGLVYCLPDHQGAALWSPPGTWNTSLLGHLRYMPDLVRLCGAHRLPQRLYGIQQVQQFHPSAPHFYLQVLAVDPASQGKGLSRQLLEPVLTHCDQAQLPAYLETCNPDNIGVYQHFGFRVCQQLRLPAGGPTAWCLWRSGTSGQRWQPGY